MTLDNNYEFETLAIHAGQEPDTQTGAVNVPIYTTSTYKQNAVGEYPFSDYSRVDNPTRSAFQEALATLEGAKHGFSFASGLAATDTLLRTLSPGDQIIIGLDVYGGTYRLISKVLSKAGIEVKPIDLTDPTNIGSAWKTGVQNLVWIETPSNPNLQIVDIAETATHTHELGGMLIVDNTFATPYLQKPLALGADVVVHSTTKYIGGHSDVIGGFVATNNEALAKQLKFLQYGVGAIASPFDTYLLLRGLKTLGVRLDRHNQNAHTIAVELVDNPKVKKVFYPGLESHPGHDIAQKQMSGYGGMVSFVAKGGAEEAKRIAESTKIFTLAESLGGVESLIEVPYLMTHASTTGSLLEVDPGLVRLSVGIEHIDDLIEDLVSAIG